MEIPQGLARILAVLDAIAAEPGARLARVAAATRLPAATVHRLLRDLAASGMLCRDADGGHRIGDRVVRLAAACPARDGVVPDILAELARATGLTAYLAVREGDEALYLHRALPPDAAMVTTTRIGHRAPLYCTGVGKALLAVGNDADARAYCRRTRLLPLTPATATTASELMRRLEVIRAKGFARDAEECEPGVACTAVALPDGRAALSLSGMATRFTAAAIAEQVRLLAAAAARLAALPDESWR